MRAPVVSATSMPRWADCLADAPAPAHSPQAFPINHALNQRLAIWQGVVTTLEVDAVTNLSENVVMDLKSVSERIMAAAGPELKEEIVTRADEVRQGEVMVTPGFALPCRYVIHVVCPKYNAKHHQASEAALQNCYKKVLLSALERGCRTVAVYAPSPRHFPADLACAQLMRAIRKHLEQYSLPALVIAAESELHSVECLTAAAGRVFPRDDTRIRIIHNPHEDHTDQAEDDTSLCDEDAAAEAAALFARSIQPQPDTQRLLAPRHTAAHDIACSHQQYERLLRRARSEDLSEVSGIGCLYQSGVDRLGRPVVIFIGKWFPIADIDLDKALLYLIKLLDPIVRGDYVIAYFHTLAASGNHPPFYWLKEVYTVLPYKYKKNLKAFYIVHPTFWTKMMTWWFTTFMAPAIKAKVHNLPGVEYLYSVMARDQLEVPAFVTEYDMTINGLHYFQPDTNNT